MTNGHGQMALGLAAMTPAELEAVERADDSRQRGLRKPGRAAAAAKNSPARKDETARQQAAMVRQCEAWGHHWQPAEIPGGTQRLALCTRCGDMAALTSRMRDEIEAKAKSWRRWTNGTGPEPD